jgi:hypothetical protein
MDKIHYGYLVDKIHCDHSVSFAIVASFPRVLNSAQHTYNSYTLPFT